MELPAALLTISIYNLTTSPIESHGKTMVGNERNPHVLSAPDVEANSRKYRSALLPMNMSISSSPSSSNAVMDGNCGNVMTFHNFVISSPIGFHTLQGLLLNIFACP